MADRLFISLWLKQWDEDLVLESFHKLLEIFPYSARRPGVQMVTVQPVDWAEPPTFEQHFPEGASAVEVLEAVEQFHHSDCAYQAVAWWDAGEELVEVKMIAYGPDFEGSDDGEGHIELDLGPDIPYRASRENLTKLVFLMHELPKKLPLRKRLLWSESGEDVSELLAKTIH